MFSLLAVTRKDQRSTGLHQTGQHWVSTDEVYLSWIPKASRASVYRSWRGGTYTYPKWPRMQNICKTHMKHRFLCWWNVCDAYVMRMWSVCAAQVNTYVSRMWNICETYAKYMWHINVFWDWIVLCLCFTYVYVCEFMCFFCRRKNKTLFCANHAK